MTLKAILKEDPHLDLGKPFLYINALTEPYGFAGRGSPIDFSAVPALSRLLVWTAGLFASVKGDKSTRDFLLSRMEKCRLPWNQSLHCNTGVEPNQPVVAIFGIVFSLSNENKSTECVHQPTAVPSRGLGLIRCAVIQLNMQYQTLICEAHERGSAQLGRIISGKITTIQAVTVD